MEEPIAMGAEAVVTASEFLGRKAVKKTRNPKSYRHPELDDMLRSVRTRNEVRMIRIARSDVVRTPVVYDVNMSVCSITMEFIEGTKVKDLLDSDPSSCEKVCSLMGEALADMHNRGISHGDYTTSNMILMKDGTLCIMDFSLGAVNAGMEGMGVDIGLLHRAFSSTHSAVEGGFERVMEAYVEKMTDADAVLKKTEEIRSRARYT
ncbi:MAG TPA: KEOPS complex kinase/ATPase Bud32 [Candidatus Methanomethylophilaceae archaeon]|nr:KEOPS complex kinase/ATPase Bud32 [Candidatus Methanomethylophilaceae archaeon]